MLAGIFAYVFIASPVTNFVLVFLIATLFVYFLAARYYNANDLPTHWHRWIRRWKTLINLVQGTYRIWKKRKEWRSWVWWFAASLAMTALLANCSTLGVPGDGPAHLNTLRFNLVRCVTCFLEVCALQRLADRLYLIMLAACIKYKNATASAFDIYRSKLRVRINSLPDETEKEYWSQLKDFIRPGLKKTEPKAEQAPVGTGNDVVDVDVSEATKTGDEHKKSV